MSELRTQDLAFYMSRIAKRRNASNLTSKEFDVLVEMYYLVKGEVGGTCISAAFEQGAAVVRTSLSVLCDKGYATRPDTVVRNGRINTLFALTEDGKNIIHEILGVNGKLNR